MPPLRVIWLWARVVVGVVILAMFAVRLGAEPFLDGFTMVTPAAIAAASAVTLLTTMCCAWRWRLVAQGLHLDLPLGTAVAEYYRSQFLNSTLPGGVVGDVHRGIVHGRRSADVSRGLRAVAWERIGGQIVQIVLAIGVLIVLPSPARSWMPAVIAVIAAVLVMGAVIARHTVQIGGSARGVRAYRTAATDIHDGLLAKGRWPGVALASIGAMAGHIVIFMIAARAAGVTLPAIQLLPLAIIVLLAMSVPTNIAGWGPREGAAALIFSAVGLGAAQGVTVAVVYGVLALIACVPGAVVLVAEWWIRDHNGLSRVTGRARRVRDLCDHPSLSDARRGVRSDPRATPGPTDRVPAAPGDTERD